MPESVWMRWRMEQNLSPCRESNPILRWLSPNRSLYTYCAISVKAISRINVISYTVGSRDIFTLFRLCNDALVCDEAF
jgi:hypothetical protein